MTIARTATIVFTGARERVVLERKFFLSTVAVAAVACVQGTTNLENDAGISPNAPDAGTPVIDYCVQLHAAQRLRAHDCFGLTLSRIQLELEQTSSLGPGQPCEDLEAASAAGRVEFSPVRAQECLETIGMASCELFFSDLIASSFAPTYPDRIQACVDVFKGKAQLGEFCSTKTEPCAAGLICDDRSILASGKHEARSRCSSSCVSTTGSRQQGESCSNVGFECGPGLACTTGMGPSVCAPIPVVEESCAETGYCFGDASCDLLSKTCRAPDIAGSACSGGFTLDDSCRGALLYCSPDNGVCREFKQIGEECRPGAFECLEGTCSPSQLCSPRSLVGESCDLTLVEPQICIRGAFCNQETGRGECVLTKPLGGTCRDDRECFDGICSGGACVQLVLPCEPVP
jgi:hypothetical protein